MEDNSRFPERHERKLDMRTTAMTGHATPTPGTQQPISDQRGQCFNSYNEFYGLYVRGSGSRRTPVGYKISSRGGESSRSLLLEC
ncbi:hypothetical protein J6590_079142 [Homalodisca vitripennis]|nr:hypothetical protein J6590_079142 [Homalodisca vitripennis]